MHGFALNVDPDMSFFGHMNPCGISDRPVATLRSLFGRRVSLEEVVELAVPRFAEASGTTAPRCSSAPSPGARAVHAVSRSTGCSTPGTFSPERRSAEPVLIRGRLPGEPPRPEWMRVRARMDDGATSSSRS